MSLTSMLDDRQSPLSRLFATELPGLADLAAAYRGLLPARATLRPAPPDDVKPAWSMLGQAIDHRIRYALSDRATPSGAARAGMVRAAGLADPGVSHGIWQTATDLPIALTELIQHELPADRSRPMLLSPPAEEELLRLCYAMSWFEAVYRTGRLWPGTPLGDAKPDLDLSSLLAAVPAYAVADLTAQMRLAADALGSLRGAYPPEDVHTGPTFAGSINAGGADADLIIGDLLLDVKATATATKARREDFLQLIGYVLLDYDDRYRITRMGIYLTRLGALITWTVSEYLDLLGARRPLAELREMCSATLAS
jgi:hypothetical protein